MFALPFIQKKVKLQRIDLTLLFQQVTKTKVPIELYRFGTLMRALKAKCEAHTVKTYGDCLADFTELLN